MKTGARVTDEVNYFRRQGQPRNTVRVVRIREPERLRWRTAVASVTQMAGQLRGRDRTVVEEPLREIVLDLGDRILRRETVLDARRNGVDLDRGEVLPTHSMWDLRRTAFLAGVEVDSLARYLKLPADYEKSIDTAGVVLIGRALSNVHRSRAQKLLVRVPEHDSGRELMRHEQYMIERAKHEIDVGRRWAALSKALVDGSL
jgi:hypothetical protein